MQGNIRIIYKKRGQTPLMCINELKKEEPNLLHFPMTYAGRLDPLAEGLLIILIGDECLKKDEYLKLGKVYEVEILFGFKTDTYDVMGKVRTSPEILFERSSDEGDGSRRQTIPNSISGSVIKNNFFDETFRNILPQFTGRIKQLYPPYSSRTVNGKPLWKWARDGKLDEIIIPSHDVYVEKIEMINEGLISGKKLLEKIKNDVSSVEGDFRQSEIISLWEDALTDKKEEKFKTVKLRIFCGSGVYVRVLVNDIGQSLGVSTVALNIKRTMVGEYKI